MIFWIWFLFFLFFIFRLCKKSHNLKKSNSLCYDSSDSHFKVEQDLVESQGNMR